MDANWLLGVTAQISATLVAIIGGFLVSRIIGAAAERRTLQFTHNDLSGRISILREERTDLEADIFRDDVVPWLREIGPSLAANLDSGGDPSVTAALETFPCDERDAAELEEVYERAKDVTRSALDYLRPMFDPEALPPPDFEDVYDADDLEALANFERLARWGAFIYLTNNLAKNNPGPVLVIPFSESPPPPPEVVLDNQRVRREKQDHIRDLLSNERLLGEQARQAEAAVASITVPGAVAGVYVLAYLSLTGMVLPLCLMARMHSVGTATMASRTAWLVFGAFTAGLVAVLGYIYLSARAAVPGKPDGSLGAKAKQRPTSPKS